MVDPLATYCSILQRSVEVCDNLSALYEPDAATDWANRTLMQTASMRMAFAERLIDPELTAGQTIAVVGVMDRYLDNHWSDYERLIKPDPAKHQQMLQLHAALRALMDETGALTNALLEGQQTGT
jgi:hypothetical protein